MSMGYGAYMELVLEDETHVLYQYGCYNLNQEEYKNEEDVKDGSILIKKTCFKEPIIREKRKKLPSKRKVIVQKKIYVDVNWVEYFSSGDIITENCSHTWELLGGSVDRMICDLLREVFHEYQKDCQIPTKIGLHY